MHRPLGGRFGCLKLAQSCFTFNTSITCGRAEPAVRCGVALRIAGVYNAQTDAGLLEEWSQVLLSTYRLLYRRRRDVRGGGEKGAYSYGYE